MKGALQFCKDYLIKSMNLDSRYPTQWLSSIFIPLPKKNNANECENLRLMSLMSHTLKIFLKIIQKENCILRPYYSKHKVPAITTNY